MRFRGVALTGACAASLGLGLLCVPTSALALSVTGNDCYALAQSGTSIDVLSVDGSVGDTVYCSVTKDGRLFADHLAYTLSNDGLASSDGGVTGIVSADFGAIDPSASYEISAYSDFDEHALLYRGRVEPVYAELDGTNSTEAARPLLCIDTRRKTMVTRRSLARLRMWMTAEKGFLSRA